MRLSAAFQVCAVGARNNSIGLCSCPQGAHSLIPLFLYNVLNNIRDKLQGHGYMPRCTSLAGRIFLILIFSVTQLLDCIWLGSLYKLEVTIPSPVCFAQARRALIRGPHHCLVCPFSQFPLFKIGEKTSKEQLYFTSLNKLKKNFM